MIGAHVIEAELTLTAGADPAAVGAAVTVELCGRVDHDGPCRWPHNSAIDTGGEPARFRTLFVADDNEAALVRQRINTALRSSSWRVLAVRPRAVAADEQGLAERLLAGPRL